MRAVDLGRKKRLHSKAQRIALTVERKTCSNPTCDVPAYRCHVHHTIEWNQGGHTNLRDADLACPRHHRLLHRKKPPRPRPTAPQPALVMRT